MRLEIPGRMDSSWLWRGLHAGLALQRLTRHLAAHRPDIVHAFLPWPSLLACAAASRARIPVVISSRRSLLAAYRPLSRLVATAARFSTARPDFIIGNSGAVTREVFELERFPAEKTATIYNGVDTSRFRPSNDRPYRNERGWGDEHLVFGMVANFLPYKRHVDFVRAAALIRERFPHARFVMAGRDDGQLDAVQREVRRLDLQSHMVFLPPQDSPVELFAAMDVCVCTSETEGFSNVLLEAMASGKPVIATAVGGNPEAVVEGETGYLVPVRSPQAVAEVAAKLGTNPSLRKQMGDSARKRVEENFTVERMVRAHENLYAELLQHSRRHS